jgi:hypothetical protein
LKDDFKFDERLAEEKKKGEEAKSPGEVGVSCQPPFARSGAFPSIGCPRDCFDGTGTRKRQLFVSSETLSSAFEVTRTKGGQPLDGRADLAVAFRIRLWDEFHALFSSLDEKCTAQLLVEV